MSDELATVLKSLDARDKSVIDTTRYGYKLQPDGGEYGLDVNGAPAYVDEKRMCVELPYADGNRRDGVGDLLEIAGIDLSRHRKNPIVLFDHGKEYKLPIALSEDPETNEYGIMLDVVAKQARAKCFFYQSDSQFQGQEGAIGHGRFCEQIFDLLAKKFIRAGSIGYLVKSARELPADPIRGIREGKHLLAVIQIDVSVVVLPCNADTVKMVLTMPNVCGKPLSPYLVKALTPFAGEKSVQLGYVEQKAVPMNTTTEDTLPDPTTNTPIPPPESRQQFLDSGVSPEDGTPDGKSGDWQDEKPVDMKAIRLKYRKKAAAMIDGEIETVSDGKADPMRTTPVGKGPIKDTSPGGTGFPSPGDIKPEKAYTTGQVAKLAGAPHSHNVSELKPGPGKPLVDRDNKFRARGTFQQRAKESFGRVAAGAPTVRPGPNQVRSYKVDTSKLTPEERAHARQAAAVQQATAKKPGGDVKPRQGVQASAPSAPPQPPTAGQPAPTRTGTQPKSNRVKDNEGRNLAKQQREQRVVNQAKAGSPKSPQPAPAAPATKPDGSTQPHGKVKPGTQPTKGGNQIRGVDAMRQQQNQLPNSATNPAASAGGSAGPAQNQTVRPGQKPNNIPQPSKTRRSATLGDKKPATQQAPFEPNVLPGDPETTSEADQRAWEPGREPKPGYESQSRQNTGERRAVGRAKRDLARASTERGAASVDKESRSRIRQSNAGRPIPAEPPMPKSTGKIKIQANRRGADYFSPEKGTLEPGEAVRPMRRQPPLMRRDQVDLRKNDQANLRKARAIQTGKSLESESSMSELEANGKSHDHDEPENKRDSEKYGALFLRRLHADKQELMRDYDALSGPLDNPKVQKLIEKVLQGYEKVISEVEALWDNEYAPHGYDDLDGRIRFDDEVEGKAIDGEEEPGEEAAEQEADDAESDDGDLVEGDEGQAEENEQFDDEQEAADDEYPPTPDTEEDGTTTSSNVPEETPPEEAVAAMGIGQEMKSLRLKYRSKNIRCDGCGCEPCECVEDADYAPEGAANEPAESLADGRDDFDAIDDAREQAHVGLSGEHVAHARNAAGFLGNLSNDATPFGREEQMESYYHGKQMHAVRDHLATQLGAKGIDVEAFAGKDFDDAETKDMLSDALAGDAKFMGAHKTFNDAGDWLHELSNTRMLGPDYRNKCGAMCKALEDVADEHEERDEDEQDDDTDAIDDESDETASDESDDAYDDPGASEDDAEHEDTFDDDSDDEDTPPDEDAADHDSDEDDTDDEFVGQPGRKSVVASKSLLASLDRRDEQIEQAERALKELLDRFA